MALALAGCSTATPLPPASDEEVPERQFTLQQVRFEERRHEQVVWRGTAQRASGDRQWMCAEQICLQRLAQSPNQASFFVRARAGTLALGEDAATFCQAVVDHPSGELHAPTARYDGKAARLDGDGPVELRFASGTTHAQGAQLFVDEGRLELLGPVLGQLGCSPAEPPSPVLAEGAD